MSSILDRPYLLEPQFPISKMGTIMSPCPPGSAIRTSSEWTRLWLSDCLKELERFLEVSQGLFGRERARSHSNFSQNDSCWIIFLSMAIPCQIGKMNKLRKR